MDHFAPVVRVIGCVQPRDALWQLRLAGGGLVWVRFREGWLRADVVPPWACYPPLTPVWGPWPVFDEAVAGPDAPVPPFREVAGILGLFDFSGVDVDDVPPA